MRAAGKEFVLGMYDAASGVVMQPYAGAKDGGATGFLKGVGRGIGGVFFKTGAAMTGVFAYSMKGLHREAKKGRDRRLTEKIRQARIRQGEIEVERWIQENGEESLRKSCMDGWKLVEEQRRERGERKQKILNELNLERRFTTRRERKKKAREEARKRDESGSTVVQEPIVANGSA
jgi:hypothetical protein